MGVDHQARSLGAASASAWLTHVDAELNFGVIKPERLAEHARIFEVAPLTATPPDVRRLAEAYDAGDWDTLESAGWLDGDQLTSEATQALIASWDAIDRASA